MVREGGVQPRDPGTSLFHSLEPRPAPSRLGRLVFLSFITALILILGSWGGALRPARAAASAGDLKVRVADRRGLGVAGVAVEVWPLMSEGPRAALIALCDKDGRASFPREYLPSAFVVTAQVNGRASRSPMLTPGSVVEPALELALPIDGRD